MSNQMIAILDILVRHQHGRQHKPDSNAELEANVYMYIHELIIMIIITRPAFNNVKPQDWNFVYD